MNNEQTTPVNLTLGQRYVAALRGLESIEATPEVKALAGEFASIAEALAIYGKAITSNLDMLLRQVDAGQDVTSSRLTRSQLGSVFTDEYAFCSSMERMNRDKLLRDAGVDPQDAAAVNEYFDKCDRALSPMVAVENN